MKMIEILISEYIDSKQILLQKATTITKTS